MFRSQVQYDAVCDRPIDRGVVVDVDGNPQPFVEVELSSDHSGYPTVRTDNQGRFRFERLVEGDKVFVYTRGKNSLERHVTTKTGDQNVKIVHEPEKRPGE